MAPALRNYECPNNVSMTGEAGYGPGTMERVLQDDVDFMWSASCFTGVETGLQGGWLAFPGSHLKPCEPTRTPVT